MGLLSRYVFRQTAGALLLILISLTGVTWIAIALRQLELMTTQGQDVLRFLGMTLLAIPSLLGFIAPIALLIASIHVLNRLNGDSELIVMTAGGMPVWSLLKPLGLLAVLVSLSVAAVNHLAGPWSQRTLKDMVVQVRTDFMSQVLQPWRFSSPETNLTVHIRDRAPNGDLLGLLLHDARDPKQVVTYLAERGQIIKQGTAVFLRMEKGHVLRRLENEPSPQIISFQSYPVDLNRLEQRVDQVQALRPRERYTTDLLRPDKNDPQYKAGPRQVHFGAARTPLQPPVRVHVCPDRAGLRGTGAEHAHQPHAGDRHRLRRGRRMPHSRHRRGQRRRRPHVGHLPALPRALRRRADLHRHDPVAPLAPPPDKVRARPGDRRRRGPLTLANLKPRRRRPAGAAMTTRS